MEQLTYEQLLTQATRLRRADQPRLLADLATAVAHDGSAPRHSVTTLRGLGKELWRGVDAQQYVNDERTAWDG